MKQNAKASVLEGMVNESRVVRGARKLIQNHPIFSPVHNSEYKTYTELDAEGFWADAKMAKSIPTYTRKHLVTTPIRLFIVSEQKRKTNLPMIEEIGLGCTFSQSTIVREAGVNADVDFFADNGGEEVPKSASH